MTTYAIYRSDTQGAHRGVLSRHKTRGTAEAKLAKLERNGGDFQYRIVEEPRVNAKVG